jgi:hypothetical protein
MTRQVHVLNLGAGVQNGGMRSMKKLPAYIWGWLEVVFAMILCYLLYAFASQGFPL